VLIGFSCAVACQHGPSGHPLGAPGNYAFPIGNAGGDLTGTYPGPTVSKINGVTYTAPLACATLTGTLGFDPQNATGCASDVNTTIQTTCGGAGVGPTVHYAEIVRRWGTSAPRLCATTAIIALSSHTDGSDPVYFDPRISGATTVVSIQGAAPTVVTSGVSLSSVTAKSRAAGTNSLLQADIAASGATGQLVENTSHLSRAWVFKNVSGTVFSFTQPLVKTTVPGFFGPAEVDTWANTDSVNLLTPVNVNLVSYVPLLETNIDAVGANVAYLYQLNIFKPQTFAPVYLGNVRVYECGIDRTIYEENGHYEYDGITLTNVLNRGGMVDVGGGVQAIGGAVTSTALVYIISASSNLALNTAAFTKDYIFGFAGTFAGFILLGQTYFDKNETFQYGYIFVVTGSQLYGTGQIDLQGTARMFLNGGSTFVSTFTGAALVSPGILLNTSSTGCSHTNAAPDVTNCGIATTPQNLDAAAGLTGFGGNAVSTRQGGSSVTNVAR
jgi:hypothetical protein